MSTNNSPTVPDIKDLVAHIGKKLSGLTKADLTRTGHPTSLVAEVIVALDINDVAARFVSIAGPNSVDAFFSDCEPRDYPGDFHIIGPLVHTIPRCCNLAEDDRLTVDEHLLETDLVNLVHTIRSGSIDYTVAMRLMGIDIESPFELADGILFRKLNLADVLSRYPTRHDFFPVSQMAEDHAPSHRVEIVTTGRCSPAELQRRSSIEQSEALVNSILHAFLIANISPHHCPSISHLRTESTIENRCEFRGYGRFSFTPMVLTQSHIEAVRRAYRLHVDTANDRVLQIALDRFIRGKKRGQHHPNRVNEPNWDKLVDYAIAMESLLLTVDGSPVTQELSYRFRLNGASLLRECEKGDVGMYFSALKHIYDLRSKVVHGCDDTAILKAANSFIFETKIDNENYSHSLGRLILIAKQLDEWLTKMLYHLTQIPVNERPFRKKGGWENLLWR